MLQAVWISKASAIQRKGRAGRCQDGHVFRIFSRNRFKFMDDFQCPEILRTPLHELCLQAKALAPHSLSIAKFLSLAPEPPIPADVKNSIDLLIVGIIHDDFYLCFYASFSQLFILLHVPISSRISKQWILRKNWRRSDSICSICRSIQFSAKWFSTLSCWSVLIRFWLSSALWRIETHVSSLISISILKISTELSSPRYLCI